MMKRTVWCALATSLLGCADVGTVPAAGGETMPKQDTFQTSEGKLTIAFVGHGTLMFRFADMVVHVDPVSR